MLMGQNLQIQHQEDLKIQNYQNIITASSVCDRVLTILTGMLNK